MATLKDIASTISLLGSVSFMSGKDDLDKSDDPFSGIMDGPEMLGNPRWPPHHEGEGEAMTRDQHAKRIGDLP